MVTDERVHRDGLNNNIQSDVPLIMYLVEDTRENICDLVAASNELKQDNMKCLLDYFVAEIEKVLLTMWAVNSSSLTDQYSETRSAQLLACVHWVAMCTVSASDATSLFVTIAQSVYLWTIPSFFFFFFRAGASCSSA